MRSYGSCVLCSGQSRAVSIRVLGETSRFWCSPGCLHIQQGSKMDSHSTSQRVQYIGGSHNGSISLSHVSVCCVSYVLCKLCSMMVFIVPVTVLFWHCFGFVIW